jgi:DUF1365 family protein
MSTQASCVYEGVVRHRRLEPVRHELSYRIAQLYLDLDELPTLFDGHPLWSARRPAPAWFRRADYLGDREVPLAEAVRSLVHERTGARPEGPVRLLTHLRYLGHCFNPVSFYYCFDRGGERVRAVVAEVTNTPWGERHQYVLAREPDGDGRTLEESFEKVFHVSPFMGMDHRYHWRLVEPGRELLVHIDSERQGRKAFDATLTLQRRELDGAALRRVLFRYPAATLATLSRIYLHAVALKLKGAPHFRHPEGGRR